MAYDLEEQEQIDAIKAWWTKYGNLVTWVLIVALASYAGWAYWNRTQAEAARNAAVIYQDLEKKLEAKNTADVQKDADQLRKEFGKTIYAQFAGLATAKLAADAGDTKTAKAQLQLVIDGNYNEEIAVIAKVRLAGVLLDEKAYDDAMKLLGGDVSEKFQVLVLDRKGDILAAQNKITEARAMYQSAIDKSEEKSQTRQYIQVKLEAIGGTPAKSAA